MHVTLTLDFRYFCNILASHLDLISLLIISAVITHTSCMFSDTIAKNYFCYSDDNSLAINVTTADELGDNLCCDWMHIRK